MEAALILMGPTATGKTDLAVDLALAFDGEIISVDSVMVYRGLDIGSAKPTADERRGIPHHLIDILDPSENYSVAAFRQQALETIAAIHKRNKLPILAGGSMLYFKALLQGIAQMPSVDADVHKTLCRELAQRGSQALHAELNEVDAVAATRIHSNDPQRLVRALGVFRATGQPLSSFHETQQESLFQYRHLKLGLLPYDRSQHRRTIAERFDSMLQLGLLNEVEQLYQRQGLHEDLPAMRAVGYRQVCRYLSGDWEVSTMRDKAIVATCQLAKRQMTWLRKESDLRRYNCLDYNKTQLFNTVDKFLTSSDIA